MNLETLNSQSRDELISTLLACCQCHGWATRVADNRPFASKEELISICDRSWSGASEKEILEAFSGHPRIGDLDALRNKYAVTAGAEQGQVAAAEEGLLLRLQAQNDAYLDKFGFIFIVCATGKTAGEMLQLLEARIDNSRDQELVNGAREQALIMQLRLNKLFEETQ